MMVRWSTMLVVVGKKVAAVVVVAVAAVDNEKTAFNGSSGGRGVQWQWQCSTAMAMDYR
jgi:hypothetical protein